MRIITNILNSKSHYEEFGFLKWIIIFFMGGVFHSIVFITLGNHILALIQKLPTITESEFGGVVIELSLSGLAIFFTPILISVIATKFLPEKRIVPPIFLQMITAVIMMFYFSFSLDLPDQQIFVGIFMSMIYLIFGGLVQDSVALGIIGRSAREDDLIKYSLTVNKPMEFVESILSKERYRNHFEFAGKVEEIRKGVRMRSKKIAEYDSVMEIKEMDNEKSMINIVYFHKGAYFFKKSEELETYADEKIHYLKKILENSHCTVEDGNSENVESLVNYIIEDASGIYAKTGGITKIGWFKIIGFVTVIGIALGIMWLGNVTEGAVALSIVILYLIFDVPKKLLSRKKIT